MTLTDVLFTVGMVLVAMAVLFIAALVINARTRPTGAHHRIDDEDASWPPELPERHPAPPHPDGRTS